VVAPQFARRLTVLVAEARFRTWKAFAAAIGRKASVVSDWKKGHVRPNVKSVDALVAYFTKTLRRRICRDDVCPVSEMSDPSGMLARVMDASPARVTNSSTETNAKMPLDSTAEAATMPGNSQPYDGGYLGMLSPREQKIVAAFRVAVLDSGGDEIGAAHAVFAALDGFVRPKAPRHSGGKA
jgi:hypothetical protein